MTQIAQRKERPGWTDAAEPRLRPWAVPPAHRPEAPHADAPPAIVIDSHHPKHYLTLRRLARRCEANGLDVILTVRDKDVTAALARENGFDPILLTRARHGPLGLLGELFAYDWRLYRLVRRRRPAVLIGNTFSVAHVGALSGTPSVVINDDDKWTNPQYPLLAYPFATRVVLPDCMRESWGPKVRRYPGLHELAYLHPDGFQPRPGLRQSLGLGPHERLFLIRLVENKASHDLGVKGFSAEAIDRLLRRLTGEGRVFISSEGPLAEPLAPYRLPTPPSAFHDVLAACDLVLTDGNTVAAEAAVLGTPSLRMTSLAPRSYLDMLERRFDLTYGFHPDESAAFFQRLEELLSRRTLEDDWRHRRQAMLATLVDPTEVFWDEVSRLLPRPPGPRPPGPRPRAPDRR